MMILAIIGGLFLLLKMIQWGARIYLILKEGRDEVLYGPKDRRAWRDMWLNHILENDRKKNQL